MFATVAYFVLLVGALISASAGVVLLAIVLGAAALAVALRYEIRWLADHTSLTRHSPRRIPHA